MFAPRKRVLDFLIATVSLLALAPVFILIAAAIRLSDGGPAFYAQERVGIGLRRFRLLKFRSMRTDADKSGWSTARNDSRITPLGRLLRTTSIDELPQLVNVLLGHMSLVGPRPMVPPQVAQLKGDEAWHRHRVRPGITGPAQVSGRSALAEDIALALDLEYAKAEPSIRRDLAILARTALIVLERRGAN